MPQRQMQKDAATDEVSDYCRNQPLDILEKCQFWAFEISYLSSAFVRFERLAKPPDCTFWRFSWTLIPNVFGLSSRLHALHSAARHANQSHEHILASHNLIPDRRNDWLGMADVRVGLCMNHGPLSRACQRLHLTDSMVLCAALRAAQVKAMESMPGLP